MSTILSERPRSRFYAVVALALAATVVLGFARTYYLRPLFDLPPLERLVHLHGLTFTAWIALLVVQTRLIAARRADLHRKLGIAGVVIAALILIAGFLTVAGRAAVPRIHPSGLTPSQFTIVGMTSLALFAAFFTLAIVFRRRASLHKRFMVLAMIATLTPASSRILTLLGLREYFVLLVPVIPVAFVAWCLARDWVRERVVHPVYLCGGIVIAAAWPLRLAAGRADWYQPIGQWIASVGA